MAVAWNRSPRRIFKAQKTVMKHFQTHTHKFAEDAAVYNDQFPHPWRLTDTKEAKNKHRNQKKWERTLTEATRKVANKSQEFKKSFDFL